MERHRIESICLKVGPVARVDSISSIRLIRLIRRRIEIGRIFINHVGR
jgi:hypothetical protein